MPDRNRHYRSAREGAVGSGFISLCHYKNTDYAVFFGGQSVQKPKKYTTADATANAAISARLPYMMATSRFAHYLKMMARDKIGSYMEAKNAEDWLNRWIRTYVNADDQATAEMKLRYPLRDARVEVVEVAGAPGSYNAVAHMRPWLQMEELTTALSMVARLPTRGNCATGSEAMSSVAASLYGAPLTAADQTRLKA